MLCQKIIFNRKFLATASFIIACSFPSFLPVTTLNAQIGIDFNRETSSGTLNLTGHYRTYSDIGGNVLPPNQNTILFNLNGYFWLSRALSTRFAIALGFPLLSPDHLKNGITAEQSLFLYDSEFAMRFTVFKTSTTVMMLGVLIDATEGHNTSILLFDTNAKSFYFQTGLGLEMEMAFALRLEYLLYFRLKVPMSTYNSTLNSELRWGFYPRQAALELAFLFHKGPSFGLSKAARNIYFGPFYRFEIRVFQLTPPRFIASHTLGVTYYVKPPF